MSAEHHLEPPSGAAELDHCPLCTHPVHVVDRRCPDCGYPLDVARGASPFTTGSWWVLVAVLAGVYAITLVLLVVAR